MANTYPVVIEALDANKQTLTAGETGVLCSTQDTKKLYYWTGTGWTQIALATSGYKASFDNPPASPSAYDDEFTSTSLDAKWTIGSTGTTNPVTTGTVNPLSSLTTPIIDLSTSPSWLLFQSDNSSAQFVRVTQTVTIASDATFFFKISGDNRIFSAAGEGSLGLFLENSGDANEGVYVEWYNSGGTGLRPRINVQNNGVFTTVSGNIVAEGTDIGHPYMVCWKNGNVYHLAYGLGTFQSTFTYIGSVIKTGTTTFDRLSLAFNTANETPSLISGFDFIRYYPSLTYALMN